MGLTEGLVEFIERQTWLDQLSTQMQKWVRSLFQGRGSTGQKVGDVLHGTWLGHPLHSALTDLPIGAYSAAAALDALEMTTGDKAFGVGSDAAIGLGLSSAVATAVTGIADWQYTQGHPRRIGSAHAILNSLAAVLYAGSLIARQKDQRQVGWGLGLLGLASTALAASLGGHLVYSEKIGVDHAPISTHPEEFEPVLAVDELRDGQMRRVEVGNTAVLLARRGDQVYAIGATCSHLGGPLAKGNMEGDTVICPWHGSRFSLKDGSLINGPSVYNQPCFEVRIQGGQIELRASREHMQRAHDDRFRQSRHFDKVEEASFESFPASDAPAWTQGPTI